MLVGRGGGDAIDHAVGEKAFLSSQLLKAGSRNSAKAVSIFLATSPLLWMLSHDMSVNGASPRKRLRSSASRIYPNEHEGSCG